MKKELMLAGMLFLSPLFLEGQSNSNKQVKLTAEQKDSLNLDTIMDYYWKEQVPSIRKLTVHQKIFDKARGLKIRIEKPEGKLRILLGIDDEDLFDPVGLDQCTVYLIHAKDSRFRIEEKEVVFDSVKHVTTYTVTGIKMINSYEEMILKETQDIVYKIIGTYASEVNLRKLIKLIDYSNFLRENYLRDRVIQKGNLKTKGSVYIEEVPVYPSANVLSKPVKKGYEIIVDIGEESIDMVSIFYSLAEIKGLIRKTGDMECENFFFKRVKGKE